MDLKRLRTFVAVADLGKVSKGAPHLRIRSALSRQISDLEHECGSSFSTVSVTAMLFCAGFDLAAFGERVAAFGHVADYFRRFLPGLIQREPVLERNAPTAAPCAVPCHKRFDRYHKSEPNGRIVPVHRALGAGLARYCLYEGGCEVSGASREDLW
jgi:Bacterial regulatory helix-turn-helix protein, lysR family